MLAVRILWGCEGEVQARSRYRPTFPAPGLPTGESGGRRGRFRRQKWPRSQPWQRLAVYGLNNCLDREARRVRLVPTGDGVLWGEGGTWCAR